MNPLLEKLNLPEFSALFDACCVRAAGESGIPQWLSPGFLRKLEAETGVLGPCLDTALEALAQLAEIPELVEFVRALYFLLEYEQGFFHVTQLPACPPGGPELAYAMEAMFPVLARIPDTCAALRKRGVSQEILENTFRSRIAASIDAGTQREGRLVFSLDYFNWCGLFAQGNVLSIGRFNMELVRKSRLPLRVFTDGSGYRLVPEGEPRPEGWQQCFAPGDSYLNVHIPGGMPLGEEDCEASYRQAAQLYRESFPECQIRGFVCISWLLSDALPGLLKEGSNILRFRERFYRFPVPTTGREVFSYLFRRDVPSLENLDLDTLPEKSSLHRNVKNLYRQGGTVPVSGGFRPMP